MQLNSTPLYKSNTVLQLINFEIISMAMHMHGFKTKLGSITQNCIWKRKKKKREKTQTKKSPKQQLGILVKK